MLNLKRRENGLSKLTSAKQIDIAILFPAIRLTFLRSKVASSLFDAIIQLVTHNSHQLLCSADFLNSKMNANIDLAEGTVQRRGRARKGGVGAERSGERRASFLRSEGRKGSGGKTGRSGPGGRGKSYSDVDMQRMLDAVEKVLPMGGDQWSDVEASYNSLRPHYVNFRDAASLKQKFSALCRLEKPTGDPNIPPDVRRAKSIQREIEAKASVAALDNDLYSLEDELMDDNAEEEGERAGDGISPDDDREEAGTWLSYVPEASIGRGDVVAGSQPGPSYRDSMPPEDVAEEERLEEMMRREKEGEAEVDEDNALESLPIDFWKPSNDIVSSMSGRKSCSL